MITRIIVKKIQIQSIAKYNMRLFGTSFCFVDHIKWYIKYYFVLVYTKDRDRVIYVYDLSFGFFFI